MRDALINVFISVVSLVAVTGIGYLFSAIRKNLNPDDKIYRFTMIIENAIDQAVKCTNQVFVNELKKNNTFDDEARKKAYEITKKYVENMITDKSKKLIEDTYGDLDTYLKTKIEECVSNNKLYTNSTLSGNLLDSNKDDDNEDKNNLSNDMSSLLYDIIHDNEETKTDIKEDK